MEYRSSPFANIPPVVKNLLIINVILYLLTNIFSSGGSYPWASALGVYYFDSSSFRGWQIITHMFMHSPGFIYDQSTILHIVFNMFALYSFGTTIEYILGSKRFLNFYLITGLGALALQMLAQAIMIYFITGSIVYNPENNLSLSAEDVQKLSHIYNTSMLGASGAICGILMAFGMLFPNAELFVMFIPIPIKAKYIIPIFLIGSLFLGIAQFAGDSIAHFAHLGGALFGFILIKVWGIRRPGGIL